MRGYDLTSEPQTLETSQNALSWFIVARFIHELYELLKTLNQVSCIQVNVSSYVTAFPMKFKIVHIRMRTF